MKMELNLLLVFRHSSRNVEQDTNTYCIQGNIRLRFIFAPLTLVVSGLFRNCIWANFNVLNY